MDGYVLGDVKLQPLDVLLESSHVCVRSWSRCALSGWCVQIGIHQDLFLREVRDQHAGGVVQSLHRVKIDRPHTIAQDVLLVHRLNRQGSPAAREVRIESGESVRL